MAVSFDSGLSSVAEPVVPSYRSAAVSAAVGAGLMLLGAGLGGVAALLLGAISALAFVSAAKSLVDAQHARRLVDALLDWGGLQGLRVEPGVFIAYYASTGAGEHRTVYSGAVFRALGGETLDIEEAWRRASQEGYVAVARMDDVFVAVPALRVVEQCCRGAVVAAVSPGWGRGGRAVLRLCRGEGCAEAEARLEGGTLYWRLNYLSRFSRARAVRLELAVKPRPPGEPKWDTKRAAELAYRKLLLAEAAEPGGLEGRLTLAPPEARVALTAAEDGGANWVSRLYSLFTAGTEAGVAAAPPLAGLRLRLVVDRPLMPDFAAEEEIMPK